MAQGSVAVRGIYAALGSGHMDRLAALAAEAEQEEAKGMPHGGRSRAAPTSGHCSRSMARPHGRAQLRHGCERQL